MADATTDKHLIWTVRLFGGPVLVDRFGQETRRFRSQKVRAMLAYLALHLGSYCPREEMYEALWPEEEVELVANRFRVTLASLRRQLEPEGAPFGSVLDVSEPRMVRLRPETVACDVSQFEALWRFGKEQEAQLLAEQPLLPGFYEEWAIEARTRYQLLALDTESPAASPGKASAPTVEPAAPAVSFLPHPKQPAALPLFLTRFFGREQERNRLIELIRTHRLVTISGIGGVGKTRLAVEIARQIALDCYFVELTPVAQPEDLAAALLKPFGILPDPTLALEDQLSRLLSRRGEVLIILDNVEALVDAVATLAVRLLGAVPDLHLLVTSRQALDIPGEAVLPLSPLPIPIEPVASAQLLDWPAVALFVDRATNSRPDFVPSTRNLEAIREICATVEGIPLALELAAAHVVSQTPGQIAHKLRSDATDLSSRQRGLSERHRSLRTVIETSLELLPAEVQTFFFTLVRFQSDWTIETARTMTDCERAEEYLEMLASASLLECREDERLGVMRFSCLATVRQFVLHAAPGGPATATDAAENLLVNGSFEQDRPGPLWITNDAGMFALPFIVPTGWKGDGSVNVNAPSYAAFSRGIPDGTNTAVVGDHTRNGRLYQDVDAMLLPGATYILSAWVGNRISYGGGGRIVLETAGGRLLAASEPISPPEGAFVQVTLSFTAGIEADESGEQLRVVLERTHGMQANFDDVRLIVAPAST
jgi:predicted ATPase